MFGDRQTEACAAKLTGGGRVALAKGFKVLPGPLGRFLASVADRKTELACALVFQVARNADGYFPDLGKFNRVSYKS
jgi:hypothetical protein